MRIFAFHLLNDFSGSPKVLMQLLKGWIADDIDVTVVTSSGRDGFLTNITGVKYSIFWYRWKANPLLRLFNLTLSQVLLVLRLLFVLRKDDIVYINTVLPFGAAILGKLKSCRVIYHIHETTMKPPLLKKFLFGIARWAADDVIYVSDYLAQQEKMKNINVHTVHNAIENEFLEIAMVKRKYHLNSNSMLMVCSLKDYKGVNEYVALAKLRPQYKFTLVVNAKQEEIDHFFKSTSMLPNLAIYPTQTNLHPFYKSADVVLNLSRIDGWVETFGLTIIEGMAYGLPAIVPTVGGITELVEEGINGYRVDSRDLTLLSQTLDQLCSDSQSYDFMRNRAIEKISSFSEDVFVKKNVMILKKQQA